MECLAHDHKGMSTGTPRFIVLRFIALHIRKKKHKKHESLYYKSQFSSLEWNPTYLQGIPEAEPGLEPRPSHPRCALLVPALSFQPQSLDYPLYRQRDPLTLWERELMIN